MRAFVAGKGSVEVLGSKVNGEHGSIDGIILPSHFLCNSVDKGFLSSFHPWSTLHWNSSWLPWLPGYLMMVPWYGLTQNLCLWPPYIYLLRTIGATPFNLIFQLGTPPANGGFVVLDITIYHCAHQHGLVGVEGGHDTLSHPWHLCVSDSGEWWFRGMVLLLMTLRLSFGALYSLTYMSPFNTPASSIPVWTATKHF